MARMPRALADAGLGDVTMLLQVHDELVFEAPADRAEAAGEVIRRVMMGAAEPVLTLSVPLEVEIGAGKSWGEAHCSPRCCCSPPISSEERRVGKEGVSTGRVRWGTYP